MAVTTTPVDQAAQRYLATHVRSRTPLELTAMLYDAAVRHAAVAAEAAARRDIAARRNAVSRTLAIIDELQGTLNLEAGGAIAAELDRLYSWMTLRLTDATVRQEAAPIAEVHRVLEILRDGWRQIAAGPAPRGEA
ncbi:MAG: flagellar export chaperone FliS [Acidobacteria bacterium]|nr:flagellar export chaperone FliS [Acidobacteriota bacterium]